MSVIRPLPSRPNLEFERKNAKALLRRLRANDPEMQLADAQLIIAREYGFASWPRLVRYFEEVARQRDSYHGSIHTLDGYLGQVDWMLRRHANGDASAATAFAAYVPRFYAMPTGDVLASEITEDEARLAVARMKGFPSWDVLVEEVARARRRDPRDPEVTPIRHARNAIRAADLDALKGVTAEYPELLHPSAYDISKGMSLIASALHYERDLCVAAMKPIMDWLATHGFDRQLELNRQLCGHKGRTTEEVRSLLERGADPNWVAPNGIPLLEHALIRYWNGEAVDLIAARTKPRKALWIAAGSGDVDAVAHFLDRDGNPTPAASAHRPDFVAIGPDWMPTHPEPDHEEILLEAFWVAMINTRTSVLDYMLARGFPVNTLRWGAPLIMAAEKNGWTTVYDSLIRGGAQP